MADGFQGMEKLQQFLNDMPLNMQKKAARQALRPAFKKMLDGAKGNSPQETGQIKRAFKMRAAPRSRKFIGIDVILDGELFNGEFYGAFLEYGTKHIKPKGFIRKAYDENEKAVEQDALNKIKQIIEDSW